MSLSTELPFTTGPDAEGQFTLSAVPLESNPPASRDFESHRWHVRIFLLRPRRIQSSRPSSIFSPDAFPLEGRVTADDPVAVRGVPVLSSAPTARIYSELDEASQ